MKKILFFLAISLVMLSCSASFEAKENLQGNEYTLTLLQIAPYVVKKPDEFSYEDRFKTENQTFYNRFIELTGGKLTYYYKNDTASLFFFEHKDLSSLYEHYRGLGGYYKSDVDGNIECMNILYHTPRLTRKEMDERRLLLFKEMMTLGNVAKFSGNREYIDTPNADFYYNTKTNRWDYTENSSWKFLEEAKQAADSAATN